METISANNIEKVPEVKWCSGLCKRFRPIEDFNKNQNYCKECRKVYIALPVSKEKRQWYRRTEDKKGQNKRRSERAQQIKQEMILAYGGICSCCGETEIRFLTLEHLEGGGNQHRKQFKRASRTWQDLKEKCWPKGYTILCWNCQMGKTHYGICPHKIILKNFLEVAV